MTGIVRKKEQGQAWESLPDTGSGGGGSQPGVWQTADFLFTETDEAGTISATLELTGGSYLFGFQLRGIADWFDTGATFKLEDESFVYFNAEEAFAADKDGGWLQAGEEGSQTKPQAQFYPDGQTITVSYTTTVADPAPTGQTRITLIYASGVVTTNVP